MDNNTVATFEPCPDCKDGSCRKCGPASSEHAAPGVRLVLRPFRFVRCPKHTTPTCTYCGPAVHSQAGTGVTMEILGERVTKRWVPSMHLQAGNDVPACRCSGVPENRLTLNRAEVTCTHCLGRRGAKARGR
jgi:hypothetical protein